jgi:hypothetical protein
VKYFSLGSTLLIPRQVNLRSLFVPSPLSWLNLASKFIWIYSSSLTWLIDSWFLNLSHSLVICNSFPNGYKTLTRISIGKLITRASAKNIAYCRIIANNQSYRTLLIADFRYSNTVHLQSWFPRFFTLWLFNVYWS